MSNEDEFYCGRTELAYPLSKGERKQRRRILMPIEAAKEIHINNPCGTKENPHECIRDVRRNIVHGSNYRCRKCSKTFAPSMDQIITITWNNK